MGEMSIAVELRDGKGKEFNRKLRAAGRVPGVVYGGGKEAISVTLDPVTLERKLKASHAGINTLIDLEGAATVAGRTVMVKDLQREPIRGTIMHADFFEIDQTRTLQVTIPIHVEGSPPGVLLGGVLEHALREVEMACLPGAIPDELVIDIGALEIGDSIHVRDLALPSGVEMISDGDLSVVSVIAPKAEEEIEPVEGEEGAEGAAEGAEAPADEGESKSDGDD
jgi:large subunit ribosomal protein L25